MEPRIDRALCTACGLCVQDCMYRKLSIDEDVAVPDPRAPCSMCGHCVAICPSGAVTLPGAAPREALGPLPPPEAVEHLIRSRRSVRHFKAKPVPRELVSRLLGAAAHAPSGCNARPVRATVVDDGRVLERIERDVERVSRLLAPVISSPLVAIPLRYAPLAALRRVADRDAAKGARLLARGLGPDRPWVTLGAPVLLLLHADPSRPTPGEDCVIAADHVSLLAQAFRLGTCWNGIVTEAVNHLPHLRRALGIPSSERVYAVLAIGWPAVRFSGAAPRAPIPVRFV